ncbi:MAG: hypothetical protein ABW126_10060 [Candidatus Sedimenticola sp. 4PFRAG1]
MEFRISEKLLAKKRRGPILVAAYVSALALLLSLPVESDEFSWSSFVFVFGVTAIIASGSNYLGYRNFYKYSLHHKINVTEAGLLSHEGDTESLLKWEKVNDIIVKKGKSGVKKLVLCTSITGKVDLTRYENLDQLCELVSNYVSANNNDL